MKEEAFLEGWRPMYEKNTRGRNEGIRMETKRDNLYTTKKRVCVLFETQHYYWCTCRRRGRVHTLQPLQSNSLNTTTWANHRYAIHDTFDKMVSRGARSGKTSKKKKKNYLEIVKRGREESNDVQYHDSQHHVPVPPAPGRPRVQE